MANSDMDTPTCPIVFRATTSSVENWTPGLSRMAK